MTYHVHYLGTTDVGVMVAKQQKLPTVMIRRTDGDFRDLPIVHTRDDVPGVEFPKWNNLPLTLFCVDTNEDAIQIVKDMREFDPCGFFCAAIDAEGNVLWTAYSRD
jgi:hypothetical protein